MKKKDIEENKEPLQTSIFWPALKNIVISYNEALYVTRIFFYCSRLYSHSFVTTRYTNIVRS